MSLLTQALLACVACGGAPPPTHNDAKREPAPGASTEPDPEPAPPTPAPPSNEPAPAELPKTVESAAPLPAAEPAKPETPTTDSIRAVIEKERTALSRCAGKVRGSVAVTLHIDPRGRAMAVFDTSAAGGTIKDSDTRACISMVLEDASYPASVRGTTFTEMLTFPLRAKP